MSSPDEALDYLKGLKDMFVKQQIQCNNCGYGIHVEEEIRRNSKTFSVFCPQCGRTQKEKTEHYV